MMRFIHSNLLALWATLALITGISCWFAVAEPTAPTAAAPAAETWALPKLPENQSRKSMDAINARNLWGIVVAANVPKEPAWTIQGIARSGTERFVLMSVEGKPVEILKAGDLLPDGTKIVQIDNDRFLVETPDKKKIAFGIYKNEPKK
jgi:hypothetical protein